MDTDHNINIVDALRATLGQIGTAGHDYLPTLLSALGVLGAGLALAWVMRSVTLRVALGIGELLRKRGLNALFGGRVRWPPATVFSNAVFWVIILICVASVMRMLGVGGLAAWLAAGAQFLPALVTAAGILLLGYLVSVALSEMVRRATAGSIDPNMPLVLARMTAILVNLVAALAALRQLGIDFVLIRTLLVIASSAFFGSVALAFAMGAKASVGNLIAAHYVRRLCSRGQRLKIGAIEGEILEISNSTVVLDTPQGRALVPAQRFNDEIVFVSGIEGAADGR